MIGVKVFLSFLRLSAVSFLFVLLTACEPVDQIKPQVPANSVEQKPTLSEVLPVDTLLRGSYLDLATEIQQIKQPEQAALMRDLFEGVVIYDQLGNIKPGIAESWTTTDQKTWIFTLREGLKWSNGEVFSAQDIVASWQRLAQSDHPQKQYLSYMNMQNASAVLQGELSVEHLGIQALDPQHIKIILDKPTPYLPQMLAHLVLLPQNEQPHVYNGAYRLISENEQEIRLEKNPHYWNTSKGYFNQVIYRKISGEQDLQQFDIVEKPKQQETITRYFPKLCTYFYEFNFKDPLLAKSAVRKALVSMIYTKGMVLKKANVLSNGLNFLPLHMQPKQEQEFQPQEIERLLQLAEIKQPISLRLTYDNSFPHNVIAERLIRAWSQSDLLRIVPEAVTYTELLEKRATGDFQLIRSGWCADYNELSAFLNLLHSTNPDNKMGFSHSDVDQLLLESLTASEQKRAEIYQKVIDIMQQEKVVLPLFQYTHAMNIQPLLAGYSLKNPTGVLYSKDLYRRVQNK
ncbi:peptide ABC transporter substrate-binding protein [Pasteurellaceae bacterium 22721_9_1]